MEKGHSNGNLPRSGILLFASNSIDSLVPSTLISQVESLLDGHRIDEAVQLADRQRRKLEENIVVDEDQADELRYVYQRIGFQCFGETMFEDAGIYLFNGEVDPRLVVSYYPHLRGSLFAADDSMDVFAGVADRLPTEVSVDDISQYSVPTVRIRPLSSLLLPFMAEASIDFNLPFHPAACSKFGTDISCDEPSQELSPHLAPNTRSAPPTVELRRILGMAAQEMLLVFLRKCRTRWKVDGSKSDHPSHAVVDTVLAKLYVEFEKTQDFYALLHEPNQIVVSEVEHLFQTTGQYSALCMLYRQRDDDPKLFELWAKLIDGTWMDEAVPDPLSDMIARLTEKRDRALIYKWGAWITKWDVERGMKLLLSQNSGKRKEKPEDDIALLHQLQGVNPDAGARYLEHLVLVKRCPIPDLHVQLAAVYLDELVDILQDDSTVKLWRAKASSYSSSRNESSFVSYFASTTPESAHKRIRLKTILFLAGSSLYDLENIRSRLIEYENILRLELAIVDGKLGNHRSALTALARGLRDGSSAEAYCILGGDVVPTGVAHTIAENSGLRNWATALFPLVTGKAGPNAAARRKVVNENLKRELLRMLVDIYIDDENGTMDAGRLLNSQAMNLDDLEIVSVLPDRWPLNVTSSFLTRSFRRALHARHEGKIVKTISAGQNLETKERTWLILREDGMTLEEAVEDENDGSYDEKALTEKVAMQLGITANLGSHPTEKVDWPPRS
ncbi:hypothetical protein BD779DRAFT_1676706 [Infundibulicybe gibba]|nr:hypothetical protein BD779DRAFT_1676706 [Infundibulicybe gibba]